MNISKLERDKCIIKILSGFKTIVVLMLITSMGIYMDFYQNHLYVQEIIQQKYQSS